MKNDFLYDLNSLLDWRVGVQWKRKEPREIKYNYTPPTNLPEFGYFTLKNSDHQLATSSWSYINGLLHKDFPKFLNECIATRDLIGSCTKYYDSIFEWWARSSSWPLSQPYLQISKCSNKFDNYCFVILHLLFAIVPCTLNIFFSLQNKNVSQMCSWSVMLVIQTYLSWKYIIYCASRAFYSQIGEVL